MKNALSPLFFIFFLVFTTIHSYSQNSTQSSSAIERLIAKKRSFNKDFGFGYRIQLYNGDELQARKFRELFKIEFPDVFTKLTYDAPEWKTHVGNYKTKLEADKDLKKFQEKFSGIIVIPLGR